MAGGIRSGVLPIPGVKMLLVGLVISWDTFR